jgi:bacteriocin-like protein
MKNRQKANQRNQRARSGLASQSLGELTDEQLQQVVGGAKKQSLPSVDYPPNPCHGLQPDLPAVQ